MRPPDMRARRQARLFTAVGANWTKFGGSVAARTRVVAAAYALAPKSLARSARLLRSPESPGEGPRGSRGNQTRLRVCAEALIRHN